MGRRKVPNEVVITMSMEEFQQVNADLLRLDLELAQLLAVPCYITDADGRTRAALIPVKFEHLNEFQDSEQSGIRGRHALASPRGVELGRADCEE